MEQDEKEWEAELTSVFRVGKAAAGCVLLVFAIVVIIMTLGVLFS